MSKVINNKVKELHIESTDGFQIGNNAWKDIILSGIQGATGYTGYTGPTGSTGYTGYTGASGTDGADFTVETNTALHGSVTATADEFESFTTDATGELAVTLEDATVEGKIKIIKLDTKDTNNMVVTPDHLQGGTTITFDASGEVAMLIFADGTWKVIYTNATLA